MAESTLSRYSDSREGLLSKREESRPRADKMMVQTQAKVVAPRTTVPVQAVLTVKSGLVGHVLVAAKSGQLYAVTPKAAGADWDKLQLGQTMELRVTEEPLPQVVSARIVTPE